MFNIKLLLLNVFKDELFRTMGSIISKKLSWMELENGTRHLVLRDEWISEKEIDLNIRKFLNYEFKYLCDKDKVNLYFYNSVFLIELSFKLEFILNNCFYKIKREDLIIKLSDLIDDLDDILKGKEEYILYLIKEGDFEDARLDYIKNITRLQFLLIYINNTLEIDEREYIGADQVQCDIANLVEKNINKDMSNCYIKIISNIFGHKIIPDQYAEMMFNTIMAITINIKDIFFIKSDCIIKKINVSSLIHDEWTNYFDKCLFWSANIRNIMNYLQVEKEKFNKLISIASLQIMFFILDNNLMNFINIILKNIDDTNDLLYEIKKYTFYKIDFEDIMSFNINKVSIRQNIYSRELFEIINESKDKKNLHMIKKEDIELIVNVFVFSSFFGYVFNKFFADDLSEILANQLSKYDSYLAKFINDIEFKGLSEQDISNECDKISQYCLQDVQSNGIFIDKEINSKLSDDLENMGLQNSEENEQDIIKEEYPITKQNTLTNYLSANNTFQNSDSPLLYKEKGSLV